MKNIKRILSLGLCVTVIVGSSVIPVFATETNTEIENEVEEYEYSLQPDTEEWAQLNHGERVLACQIPEETLIDMTTEELVTAVLNYPCFIDMIFYNSYQDGFEVVKDNFNGLQELLNREDSGSCLLDVYRNVNLVQIINSNNEDEKFDDSLNMLYLETILAQPEISETLSNEELTELMELIENNYEIQIANEDKTASLSFSAYYESLAVQQGVELYDYETSVETPNNSTVKVIVRTGTDTAYANRAALKKSIEENYPGASVVGDATIKYNCHAYAWAGSTSVWMNDPSKYWTDGSYSLKTSNSPSAVGQKAYYPGSGNEHSGNVIRLSGNQIRSKWGEQSLVEHTVANCPYFFIPLSVKFYGR